MRRAQRADELRADRFRRFFEQHHGPVRAYVSRRVADSSRVDDVVAETFLVAWRRFGDVPADDRAALMWLLRIAHFTFLNTFRADERRHALVERLSGDDSRRTERGPEEHVEQAESRREIAQALLALPDGDRDLLLLATWEGLSGPELADVLSCSVNAAWTRLSRARARFRQVYETSPAAAGGRA